MDNYCLSRKGIQSLVECRINNKDISDEHLTEIFDRALNYWDINVISCNSLFSSILEKHQENESIKNDVISSYYDLTKEMSLSIEEFSRDFIDYIYNNKMPIYRNSTLIKLEEAKRNRNTALCEDLIVERNASFEEDLISIIEDYHAKVYR